MVRVVMHVDMDAFFAAVEELDHPELRGKPLIVGSLSARGVVSTCSYAARAFGVHSAMPMEQARRLCPEGVFLEGRMSRYAEVSREIFEIFSRYSPLVEPLSIDEAFLELTGMERLMKGTAEGYARRLKREIKERTGLTASVGLAPNKFIAKIASDLKKPDGLVVVRAGEELAFLSPLPVSRIWGVGKKTEAILLRLGLDTVGKLRAAPLATLRLYLGHSAGESLYRLSRGIDDRPVAPREDAKSIGKEMTFEEDLETREAAEEALLLLSTKVGSRLRKAGRLARVIALKLRRADFTTITRRRTLTSATCYDEDIYRAARELFRETFVTRGIRLLGVSAGGLTTGAELSLFEDTEKKESLYRAIDGIKEKFGAGLIKPGRLLNKK